MDTRELPAIDDRDRILRRPPGLLGLLSALAWGAVVGVALGAGDVVWNDAASSTWSLVANTAAAWGVAAFLLGLAQRRSPLPSALAGIVMLATAVEAYYAVAARGSAASSLSLMRSDVAQEWLWVAVLAGAALGLAGSLAAGRSWLGASAGFATGVAVPLGAALHLLPDNPGSSSHSEGVDLLIVAVVLWCLSLRRPLVALLAAVLSVPAALGVAALLAGAQIAA